MKIRTLFSTVAATLVLTAGSAVAAGPEFIDGSGTLSPQAAPPSGCTVCTVPYKGTATTVLGGVSVPFTVVGTVTGYLKTATPSGTGGACVRVIGNFTFTDASGKDSIKSQTFGEHCTLLSSLTNLTATDIGTYSNISSTGTAFGAPRGVGEIASKTLSNGVLEFTIHGTL